MSDYFSSGDCFLTNDNMVIMVDYDIAGFSNPREQGDNIDEFYMWEGNFLSPDKVSSCIGNNSLRDWFWEHIGADPSTNIADAVSCVEKQGGILVPLIWGNVSVKPLDVSLYPHVPVDEIDGACYMPKKSVLEVYSDLSDCSYQTARMIMLEDIRMYNEWAEGSVYMACPYDALTAAPDGACGPFYGFDMRENGFLSEFSIKEYLGNYPDISACFEDNAEKLGIIYVKEEPLEKRILDGKWEGIEDASLRADSAFQKRMGDVLSLAERCFDDTDKYGFDPGNGLWQELIETLRAYSEGSLTPQEEFVRSLDCCEEI